MRSGCVGCRTVDRATCRECGLCAPGARHPLAAGADRYRPAIVTYPSGDPHPNESSYLRAERGGYLFGYFDPGATALDPRQQPPGFRTEQIPPPKEIVEESIRRLGPIFPVLQRLPIAEYRQGMVCCSPDGWYVLGPLPGHDRMWLATACEAMGIAGSGAVGKWLADWITTGSARRGPLAMAPAQLSAQKMTEHELREACRRTYANYYSLRGGANLQRRREVMALKAEGRSRTMLSSELSKIRSTALTFLSLAAASIVLARSGRAAEAADLSGVPQIHADFRGLRDARMRWWRDAKFGMFMHWGPVSLSGKEFDWSRKAHRPWDVSGMQTPRTTDPEYDNLYKKFNPVKFDAEKWVKIAKDAGMKYMVLVCKHHDGFSMFDSKLTGYDIMATPYGRDIVKQFAAACHKANMRLGFITRRATGITPITLLATTRSTTPFTAVRSRSCWATTAKWT